MAKTPGRGSEQFVVRLPDGMRDRIKQAAETSGRSMNQEIVERLQESFEYPELRAAAARERSYIETGWEKAKTELAAAKDALEQQKIITRQLQALIGDNSTKARQDQEIVETIEGKFAELMEVKQANEDMARHMALLREELMATAKALNAMLGVTADELPSGSLFGGRKRPAKD